MTDIKQIDKRGRREIRNRKKQRMDKRKSEVAVGFPTPPPPKKKCWERNCTRERLNKPATHTHTDDKRRHEGEKSDVTSVRAIQKRNHNFIIIVYSIYIYFVFVFKNAHGKVQRLSHTDTTPVLCVSMESSQKRIRNT